MRAELKALLEEWQYVRGLTRSFVESLTDADLDRPLPRRTLNSIRKHGEELIEVQCCYVEALDSGVMSLDGYEDATLPGDTPRGELLRRFQDLDARLVGRMEALDGHETVNWFGEDKPVFWHITAMISHESMHVGQVVAFCYATGIEIPREVVSAMALSG